MLKSFLELIDSPILNKGPVVIFIWKNQAGWPIEAITPNVAKCFGYPPQSLISGEINFIDLVHPADLDTLTSEVVSGSQDGADSFVCTPYRIKNKNGQWRYIHNDIIIYRDEENNISRYIGYVLDISREKELEAKLIHANLFLNTTLDGLQALVFVMDLKTCEILYINKYAQECFGDVVGKKCFEALQDNNNICPFCPIDEQRRDSDTSFSNEIVSWENNNKISNKWYSLNAKTMRWIDGRAVQIQVGIDITEEHFAKERLIEAKNEAEKAKDTNETLLLKQSQMASMGEMIGAIAHQWRQPLNSFSLLIQDLEMAYDFNELDKTYLTDTVTRCKTLVKFMSQTIDDFRAFFQQNRDIVEFSLLHSIKQVISFLDAQFRVNNINIELIGTDALIYGLPNEFKQVILNILVNAKDAFKEREIQNASVKIELIVTPNSATITFIDNAGGIEQNIIDKVFNPYFTTKESKGGTGIGLYVGKTIIEEHMNGNLKVYNNDNGATFIISLPL